MKKFVAIAIIFLVVVAAGTYLTPWTAEYEVKTAAKTTCNDYIKEKQGYKDLKPAEQFVKRCNPAGVRLKEGQFAFSVEENKGLGLFRCHYKVAWKSSTPVFLIGDFFPETPPLTMIHRIDAWHEVKSSY